MDVHERSTMDALVDITHKIEVEPPTRNRDWQTQTGLNAETLTHEPVEVRTRFAMDSASATTQLQAETTIQVEQQSRLNTETLTHEPVDVQTQPANVVQIEAETLTQLRDAETQTPDVETSKTEIPTQSGDAEIHIQYHMDLQRQSSALLEVASAISGVSADSSPEVLAKILQDRWQEKEAETQRLREELRRAAEEKSTAQAQVKDLITAASSISEATEDSTPEDVAEKLLEARQVLDVWRSETKAIWKERCRAMKNKMDRQIKTLADPIRVVTGITDPTKTPKALARNLRQTWDQVQAQNDDLELDLKAANDRVKHLEMDLEAQAQNVKCLATDIGVTQGISHSDVVSKIRRSFDDLQKELRDREQQRLAARDSISVKNEQIKDLKTKMESMTSSLEDLQLLFAKSKKKGKKWIKKPRLRWFKREPEQQEVPLDLEQMQTDLTKKSTTISLLEAKLITMTDQVKKLEMSEKREKDRVERQKAARTELQDDIKLLQFDNSRKETLIQSLRELVETLKKNCLRKKRGGARYRVRNTVDHMTVASLPNIKCELLDRDDLLPFSCFQKPGDLGSMRVLGKGTYGKVFLGRHRQNDQPIAIKQPVLHSGYCQDMLKEEKITMKDRAMKESMVQQLLSGSPYFPKMLGMVTVGEDLCMVMDFIGNRKTGKTYPLYQALTRFMPNPRIDLNNMLQVCEDVIEGIMELHQKGYLHNDLKSNNVLLERRSERWHAVIIDLGLVSSIAYSNQKRFSDEKRAEYRAGSGCYFLAPEIVLYGQRYSVASDIFSCGVLLMSIARKIEVTEVAELAESCTKQDPLQRPHSMGEVLRKMEAISAFYS